MAKSTNWNLVAAVIGALLVGAGEGAGAGGSSDRFSREHHFLLQPGADPSVIEIVVSRGHEIAAIANGVIRVAPGASDRSAPLVIDPLLSVHPHS